MQSIAYLIYANLQHTVDLLCVMFNTHTHTHTHTHMHTHIQTKMIT